MKFAISLILLGLACMICGGVAIAATKDKTCGVTSERCQMVGCDKSTITVDGKKAGGYSQGPSNIAGTCVDGNPGDKCPTSQYVCKKTYYYDSNCTQSIVTQNFPGNFCK